MSVSSWIRVRSERAFGRLERVTPVTSRDRGWIALSMLPALVAVSIYLSTNAYPAFGAGLYVEFAEQIAANGFVPPTNVEHYTSDGVPFSYPPLQFYVVAVLLELGAEPVTIARVLPGLAVVLATIPAYVLGRDLTDSRPAGAAVAVALSLNPQVLQWHVSAGGVVRGFAFLYALVAISAAYRAFTTERLRPVVVATVAFGCTVLSHPTYTVFAAGSILICYLAESRTVAGFGRGLVIGLGGAVIASPWIAWAIATFGVDQFTSAAGTHGGVGGGANAIIGYASLAVLVPLAAGAYLLFRRRVFVPLWLAFAELAFKQPRFSYAVGAFAIAATVVDVVDRTNVVGVASDVARSLSVDEHATIGAVAAVCLVLSTAVGGAYLAHEMTLESDPTTPEFLDDESVEAMEWAERETDEDATFVVLGDAAEWFPLLADRTIVVGPWGVEWRNPDLFYDHIRAYETSSRCQTARCVEAASTNVSRVPEYVVVPKGSYTVRGHPAKQFGVLDRSFEASADWERAYENDGVVVFHAVETDTDVALDSRPVDHVGAR
ncbi:ArnT family glycosyltransferase [Halorubellus litoreus]|uniref:ArnT family glycosyltransferase n=1 Tax=Halorubellus litoreus TaxID=755308 RepID=A0ABD5VP74_9EURY